MGRKKTEIKRIEKEDRRDVCFSKRRQSLFNKAGELSLLCNADTAVVVFSRAGKAFSYGHPSVGAMAIVTPNNPSLGGGTHDSEQSSARDWMMQDYLQYCHCHIQTCKWHSHLNSSLKGMQGVTPADTHLQESSYGPTDEIVCANHKLPGV
uniref:MADS-box domain-containing protein n=1 Tax=Oryza brachyantha TaxID=4533 RepID=J3MDK8_ORYBR